MTNLIHPTAIIDSTAQIGENVEIGPNVVIGPNVKLENNIKIYPFAYMEHCEIGEGTSIGSGASIGTPPQDLGYNGAPTKAIIGKNCQIREQVTVHRSATEGHTTNVGDECLLMVACHVAHDCKLGHNVILANNAILGGHVQIGDYAFIGGVSAIHQGIRVGKMAIMSGFSATRKDIPPYAKTDERMAKIAGLNVVALKRRGFSSEEREILRQAYKLIWYSNFNTTQGVQQVKKEIPMNEHIKTLIEFIESSKKGVIRA